MTRPKLKKAFRSKRSIFQRVFHNGVFDHEVEHKLTVYTDDNMARSPYFARVGATGCMQTIRFDKQNQRFEADDIHVRAIPIRNIADLMSDRENEA